ncbi:MAG: HAMP domain-containing histidine kinase [Polyangiaceae bacterium]|nr:HAMP domain-containing histidine kinase [Polyangiaceae bacterium]
MSERAPRERLFYYALVPAILIAVFVLGTLTLRITPKIEDAQREGVLKLTYDLAGERAQILDDHIIRQDNVVAAYTDRAEPSQIGRRWLATAARETPSVRAILVLDLTTDEHEVLAFASRNPSRDDDVFRRLLLTRLFDEMNFDEPSEELRHLHEAVDERQYLLSYWQRTQSGQRHMVVAWHDVDKVVLDIMPQLFRDPDKGSARMNVMDEKGRIVFGPPLKVGEPTVGRPFPTTLYNWQVQVRLASDEVVRKQVERRRLIELSLVLVAGLVTVAGLVLGIRSSLKERRLAALKSDFVANVSHELKTPLSLIRMFGELLLLDRVTNDDKRKQYLQIIVGESERLTALIENVLDFARVERGKIDYDFTEGNVAEVAKRAVEIYRFRATRENIALDLVVGEELPAAKIDTRALELAVMNLIDNALKYAKDGEKIVVTVEATSREVVVSVSDFGPGVPKEEQARIFERFYRGSAAGSTRARGSGIGLALVRYIVESHQGKVRVVSPTQPDGRGTTFVIEVPAIGGLATPRAPAP